MTVYGYSEELPTKVIPVVTAATALTLPDTGETIILVLNQALGFGSQLSHSLLSTMQLRYNGIRVDDAPRQFVQHADSTFSLWVPPSGDFPDGLQLPLQLEGSTVYLETRAPTDQEVETCRRVELTSDAVWDPNSEHFAHDEAVASEQSIDLPPDVMRTVSSVSCSTGTSNLCAIRSILESEFYLPFGSEGLETDDLVGSFGVAKLRSTNRQSKVTKEDLSQLWQIGLEAAERTLRATTQRGVRTITRPLTRRLRTRQEHLRYHVLNCQFYTDTLFSKVKTLEGNTCGQLYVTDFDFVYFYPMRSKSEAKYSLDALVRHVNGTPARLLSDGAAELRHGDYGKRTKELCIHHTLSEPESHWQNRAESGIREWKKQVVLLMTKYKIPKRLWDFVGEWVAAIRQLTVHGTPTLRGRTAMELITGFTPDISEYTEFHIYEPVHYHSDEDFPHDKRVLGRWLGVAHDVGAPMCYWILSETGKKTIARSTVYKIPQLDTETDKFKSELAELDKKIHDRLGEELTEDDIRDSTNRFIDLEDVIEELDWEAFDKNLESPEADDYTPEELDELIGAEIQVAKGDSVLMGRVKHRARDEDGRPIGERNSNPILDTRLYEVQFPDGHYEQYGTNALVENLYSQVDAEGRQFLLLDEIVGHRADDTALKKGQEWIRIPSGNRRKLTTKGWKLCCSWKDGSTSWVPLKDMKNSYPVQVAEYAKASGIDDEPAFAWWVKHVLRKRERILKKVKSKYWRMTHKFGFELPHNVKEALEIDRKTGTTFWREAIELEMKNVMPAFKFVDDGDNIPIGYKEIPLHIVFDIKMDFTRKARLVAGGHVTDPPSALTYSSVVSRDSVRLIFLAAALNDLDIKSADVRNAYLNAPTQEKYWARAGPEFGSNEGRRVLIIRALYGLKGSAAAWRSFFAAALRQMGWKSCEKADPDVWMRAAVKPDGTEYYEYLLVYVDDLLIASHDPGKVIQSIKKLFTLKDDSVGPPTRYLGSSISEFTIDTRDGPIKTWAMSADEYLKNALTNVEQKLDEVDKRLPKKAPMYPMQSNYRPELDVTGMLDDQGVTTYQELVGILRWAVELGRIDIYHAVSVLSQYLAAPRIGHLEQVLHIFAYLKGHLRSSIVFDPTQPEFHDDQFENADWSEFYTDAKEVLPPGMPEPRGNSVSMTCFVDANHAGNQVTRRSHSGIVIYVNRAPIVWYSRRQNTVEASSFGSEFIAMRIAVEMIESLRYKIRMFGIPLEGPANLFCDNNSVVNNASKPESQLKKRHVSIAYHRCREACAAGVVRIAWCDGKENPADVLTKNVVGPSFKYLLRMMLW